MSDDKKPDQGFIDKMREYMMGHGGLGTTDLKDYDVAMNVDQSSGTAKGYADGGVVEPDLGGVPTPNEDPSILERINSLMGSPVAKMANFAVNPLAGLAQSLPKFLPGIIHAESPTIGKLAGLAESPTAAAPLPPTPPPVQAPQDVPHETIQAPTHVPQAPMPGLQDVLSQAQGAGGQLYGQYTPEMRNQLYAAMLQRQNSTPMAAGNTLASVGDAIARGYGRDQTNFLDKSLQGEQESRKEGLEAFDTTQKGKLAETSAGMDLQKLDPHTAISKLIVSSYEPVLRALKYTPQQIANMSGSQVEAVAKVGAEYGGKELENLVNQARLIVENNFHKNELGVRENEIRTKALENLSQRPISSLLPTAANAAIKQQAGLTGGTTGQGSALAPGEVIRHTPDGRQAIFDEQSKQFKRYL